MTSALPLTVRSQMAPEQEAGLSPRSPPLPPGTLSDVINQEDLEPETSLSPGELFGAG